ncbi:MAG: sugar ABC transporter permease [Paenibacillaceae bacterium ZCTH02-B3]|nr:MAG: sugar ABC transporter permease [Paenibacillaceae bacterium ZCTH02-B3]
MAKSVRQSLYYVLLWLISIAFFLPVLWIFLAAFKTKEQILAIPPKWIFTPTFENISNMFSGMNFEKYAVNSVIISLSAVVIAIIVSFFASYSFSRYKPKGTDFLMFLLLSMRMVPGAAVVVPIYLMYTALGWKDTYYGIILLYAMFSIPFSVWILKGFIDGVSLRYDETALVNGGSRMHVMFRVILPQVKPGLVAAFIFNIIFVWNEFLFNFIIGGKKVTTIPVALATGLYKTHGVDWTFIASLSLVYMLPLILMIYFFQRYLLVGMTFGTVRGEV